LGKTEAKFEQILLYLGNQNLASSKTFDLLRRAVKGTEQLFFLPFFLEGRDSETGTITSQAHPLRT